MLRSNPKGVRWEYLERAAPRPLAECTPELLFEAVVHFADVPDATLVAFLKEQVREEKVLHLSPWEDDTTYQRLSTYDAGSNIEAIHMHMERQSKVRAILRAVFVVPPELSHPWIKSDNRLALDWQSIYSPRDRHLITFESLSDILGYKRRHPISFKHD
jgi:hypothetical protein